jgi:GH15 family glucan-1,4-alpha-glucosidase
LIGDSTTVALVSLHGSIDWLCLPRIDSDACFAQLLGTNKNGYWSISPAAEVKTVEHHYRKDTLILETEYTCDGGRVRVTDFMARGAVHDLIRIVEGIDGEVPMHCDLLVRFGYGKDIPWIKLEGSRVVFTSGPHSLAFDSTVALQPAWDDSRIETTFAVRKGQKVGFSLEYFPSNEARPPPYDLTGLGGALQTCEKFWHDWVSHCTYEGPWRDAVVRSLITLKTLTHQPTGGIVAAPTTSLPEELQGVRNWDYRYCWIRDSTLTLDALMRNGYTDEAKAWGDWLMRAAAGAPAQVQIMYGVGGEHRLTEVELPWLSGYEESRPVRIGNGAYDQFQLDAYGEIIHAFYDGMVKGLPAIGSGDQIMVLVDFVEKNWQRTDEGIWEVRGDNARHFTHSKLMAWVAVDRAIRLYEEFGVGRGHKLENRIPRWRALRDVIRNDILARAWNPQRGAFVQYYGSSDLDASVLLIPHAGFLPADDPRMLSTVAAIEKGLTWDGLVLRYQTEAGKDGLPGHEATFLICSFWLADNYAMVGRIADAEALLSRLVSLTSELGLLAEEYHPGLHRQLGNFPQAFSHIGLINTACILEESAKKFGRAERLPAGHATMH